MKRLVFAAAAVAAMMGTASAADLASRPVYKATPAAVVAYNWSGIYVGGHVGWGWQNATATLETASVPFPAGTRAVGHDDAFLGGGQVGVNWQNGNLVLGLEGDFSWTDSKGSVTVTSPVLPAITTTGTTNYNWFATATARAGYAWNNWLLYVKGGAAWANFDVGGSNAVGGVVVATVNGFSDTRMGWTVGAGFEHGFAGNWSWKAEYDYMDFGTATYNTTTVPSTGVTTISHDLTAHAVKVGLNYRFGHL